MSHQLKYKLGILTKLVYITLFFSSTMLAEYKK